MTTSTSPPPPPPPPQILTLDLLTHVLSSTLFHPFLSALIPLCLRAQATAYSSPAFILTASFALAVSAYHLFYYFDQWLAFGPARKVEWAKEVVVITGGKGGLGGQLAGVLGMRGVDVAVLDVEVTSEEEEEGGEGGGGGGGVRFYRCDVGDREQLERVWGRVVKELGTPTILINNAAISSPSPLLSQPPSEVSRLFSINTLAHFTLTQLFLRTLLTTSSRSHHRHRRSSSNSNRGGHIVTVASVLGHLGAANLSAYTASKAALLAYHASLSAELRQTAPAVKMVLVAQGQLDTALFQGVEVRGWLQRFLGPVVGAREVAVRIVRLLDEGKGGEVRVPVFARMVAWLLVLPVGVGRLLRDFSGVDAVVEGDGGMGLADGEGEGVEKNRGVKGGQDEDEGEDDSEDDSESGDSE